MNKKIAAVAVAGLFAAPAVALAQSSVTISGVLKQSYEFMKVSDYQTGGGRAVGSGPKSSSGLSDDSSRIIFNVREDLGGGLAAIGQIDMRFTPDVGGGPAANGNTHVGLNSKSWGTVIFGRQDLHYFNTSSNMTSKANTLRSDSISILAYAGAIGANGAAVNGGTAIAGATRTNNVIRYTTPNWGGFTGQIAYSSNAPAQDNDIGNALDNRKGRAWNLHPDYSAANWQVGYSYWNSKPDGGGTTAATADQRAHRLYGNYTFGFGLKIGLAWDNSKLEGNAGAVDGNTLSKRTAWSVPVRYEFMGKHTLNAHYTWARKDTGDIADAFGNADTKANMWAIGYNYDLSKRTSVGLTYARIKNQSNAGYQFFTQQSLGLGAGGTMAGEDPRLFATTIRHAF